MRTISLICILAFAVISCKQNSIEDSLSDVENFFIQIGNIATITKEDIKFYDQSSHYLHLEKSGIEKLSGHTNDTKFWVIYKGKTLLEGVAFPSDEELRCNGTPVLSYEHPYISEKDVLVFLFFKSYEHIALGGYDLKDDMVDAFVEMGLHREGLKCEIDRVERQEGVVTLHLTLTNYDPVTYSFFDPQKMGDSLYFQYTLGLSLISMNTGAWYDNNYWQWEAIEDCLCGKEWTSTINEGESKSLTLNHYQFDEFPTGDYCAKFEFIGKTSYGPHHENISNGSEMWRGGHFAVKLITVE